MPLPRSPSVVGVVAFVVFSSWYLRETRETYHTRYLPSSGEAPTKNKDNGPGAEFECPSGLLPLDSTEPWEWNVTSSRRSLRATFGDRDNRTASARAPSRIISFRLDKEKHSAHYNRTRNSLAKFNYSSVVCEVDSVDGAAWAKRGNSSAITQLHLQLDQGARKVGGEGCFLSMLGAWRLGLKHNMPIISLEADTVAIKAWDISPDVYKDYDLLFLQDNPMSRRKCTTHQPNSASVREGLSYWFGAGAVLYTNNNPERFERVVKEELIDRTATMPIDHWMNKMWREKRLRIGSLCPNFFRQVEDHNSTIANDPGRK